MLEMDLFGWPQQGQRTPPKKKEKALSNHSFLPCQESEEEASSESHTFNQRLSEVTPHHHQMIDVESRCNTENPRFLSNESKLKRKVIATEPSFKVSSEETKGGPRSEMSQPLTCQESSLSHEASRQQQDVIESDPILTSEELLISPVRGTSQHAGEIEIEPQISFGLQGISGF